MSGIPTFPVAPRLEPSGVSDLGQPMHLRKMKFCLSQELPTRNLSQITGVT